MFSFLAPAFLVGIAAAAVPLILHLLKREPEPRVQFAAVKLLRRAPVELAEKRHLRELLLLALRIATLALLAVAFARPFFPSGGLAATSGATIVAIDTSYSMSAPGRMARARQLAREAIERVPAADLVGVLAFDEVADVLVKPSADRALALAAVERAAAGFGATRYRAGLGAAAQALGGRRGTIVVVTDLQESGWDAGDRASVPESAKIELADVGVMPPNLAVTSIAPAADRVVATLRATGASARETRVTLVLDEREAGEMTVSVGPDVPVEVALPSAAGASKAEIHIEDRDGLQADNVRYAVLDPAGQASVLLVTASGDLDREAFYAQQALGAGGPRRQAYHVVGTGAARLAGAGAEPLSARAAILLFSTKGLDRHGREALAAYVRAGGGILIAAGPEIDADVVSEVLGGAAPLRIIRPENAKPELRTLAPADVRHPIFRPFGASAATLGLVKFRQVARISGSQCQTLARFTSGEAALIDCPAGDGRALVVASDLDNRWNDFPLHPSFVPFLHEAVRYLASGRPHGTDFLVGDAPGGAHRTAGFVELADPTAPGAPRLAAVNVDPREGEPSRLSADEFQSAVVRLKEIASSEARLDRAQQEDRQHLWQFVLVMMIATLVCEGLLASRTA